MDDAPLSAQDLPREGEIVEIVYRLAKPEEAHLDLILLTGGKRRRLRFHGPRVVQFAETMPASLQGLDVQDVRTQSFGSVSLWVSVADGAVTFWARSVSDLTTKKADRSDESRPAALLAEDLRNFGKQGIPVSSFVYRPPASTSSALRHFSISTRPYRS